MVLVDFYTKVEFGDPKVSQRMGSSISKESVKKGLIGSGVTAGCLALHAILRSLGAGTSNALAAVIFVDGTLPLMTLQELENRGIRRWMTKYGIAIACGLLSTVVGVGLNSVIRPNVGAYVSYISIPMMVYVCQDVLPSRDVDDRVVNVCLGVAAAGAVGGVAQICLNAHQLYIQYVVSQVLGYHTHWARDYEGFAHSVYAGVPRLL